MTPIHRRQLKRASRNYIIIHNLLTTDYDLRKWYNETFSIKERMYLRYLLPKFRKWSKDGHPIMFRSMYPEVLVKMSEVKV